MQIGLVGLGRMGMNMGRRWLQGGHEVVAFNRSMEKAKELAKEGATATELNFDNELSLVPTFAPIQHLIHGHL